MMQDSERHCSSIGADCVDLAFHCLGDLHG